jgi:ketosteroid isomerase-like protein
MPSPEENLATVKRIYDAFERDDLDALLAELTEDVDFAAEANPPTGPWHGLHKGHEGVADWWRLLDSVGGGNDSEFIPIAYGTSENEVFALIEYRFTARESGREVEMHLHHYFRFREDGKADYVRGSEDTHQVALAFPSVSA